MTSVFLTPKVDMVDRPKAILVFPRVTEEKKSAHEWLPFSLLTTASALLEDGTVDVVLFDQNHQGEAAWLQLLDDHLETAICVGFSVMTGGQQIENTVRMAAEVKARAPHVPVVLGGPHVNVLPDQTAEHNLVDAVLVGPGQGSMPAYVRALRFSDPLDEVPGLVAKQDVGWTRGPVNPPKAGFFGTYPFQLVDLAKYVHDNPAIGDRTINFVSSQGCVYKCRFCYELNHPKLRRMNSDSLVEQVHQLVEELGINGVKFYDADWFIDLKRAVGFAEGLIERKLDVKWAASINPNDILQARKRYPGFMALMAKSGLSRLLMGVESGDDRVLREVVNKGVTRAQILSAASEVAEAGILGSYTFIIGFPGETPGNLAATCSLIREMWELPVPPETRVHVYTPYPGTPLYQEAEDAGFVAPKSLEDWKQCDYYQAHTPWTSYVHVELARAYTRQSNGSWSA